MIFDMTGDVGALQPTRNEICRRLGKEEGRRIEDRRERAGDPAIGAIHGLPHALAVRSATRGAASLAPLALYTRGLILVALHAGIGGGRHGA